MATEEDRTIHAPGRVRDHAILGELTAGPRETFTFDGEVIVGVRGEPLAAALLAAGVRIFRTMPRYGDPRGGYCMVGRCADCLVEVNGVPGARACVTPVQAGLVVRTQYGPGEGDGLNVADDAS